MSMRKAWTLVKRDLYVVRWWLLVLVIVLCGDMAIRLAESLLWNAELGWGTQQASEFWWRMLEHADAWTVSLALGCWFGLVVALFQEDRLDGKAAFWQARPASVWRLLICRVVSLAVLLGGLWLFLSVAEGSWSLWWMHAPVALAGLAAAVSVLSPGWRRLAMGLVGVCGLVWLGIAAWPWLMRWLGPQDAFTRAVSNLWLVGGLAAWAALVFHVKFKRAFLSWTLLVTGLVGAWLSMVLLPELQTRRGQDFGAAELTDGIELLFDPSARGDVRRSISGGVYVTEISRPGTLVGVPPDLSARVTLRDAVLSNDAEEQVSGNPSFLMRLDRTATLFPETVGHTPVRARQERVSSTLMTGESAVLGLFVDQHCMYQTEAEVTLFQPEIVYRLPVGEAGAWRDDYLAIRVKDFDVRRRVTYTSRRLRRTCLPQDEEPGYLRAFLVHEHDKGPHEAEEVVFVRERSLARSRLPVVATGLWIGDGHEPLDKIVIPKNPTSSEAESLIARIANARGNSKVKHLFTLGADHLPAILRAGRASKEGRFRSECHLVCRGLAEERHRDLIIKYNTLDFDLCGLLVDRGWMGAEALGVMMEEAELNPWKPLPEAWVDALATASVQRERAVKVLGDRLARSFHPKMSAGFSSGPRFYQVLQGIDGFPLEETIRRGWKDYRFGSAWSRSDAPLLKIGLEHGQPGALFIAASLLEGLTEYDGDRGLLETDMNGSFPSVTRSPISKTLDTNIFHDDIEDLRSSVLESCDFPPEAEFDELYWIKEHASRLTYDKGTKKWLLPKP